MTPTTRMNKLLLMEILVIIVLLIGVVARCDSKSQNMLQFMIPTSDGTAKLNTIVSYPDPDLNADKPHDLVFERTPYGQGRLSDDRMVLNSAQYLYAGQDLRGCHNSTGEYDMWRSEWQDSQSTIQYLSKNLKGFSGNVFSVGASANAIASYFQTREKVDWLKGQCLLVGTADVYNFVFQGGAFRQQDLTYWLKFYAYQPQFVQKVLDHESYSEFWEPVTLKSGENVTFPSLHISGWADLFLNGTLNAFDMYRKNRPNDTYLIVLPTGHCTKSQISFPGTDLMLHPEIFCPYLFKYGSLPSLDYVTFYMMGPDSVESGTMGNFYVTMKDFPETRPIEFVLTSNQKLQAASNQDSMTYFGKPRVQTNPGKIPYVYNPSNPTPTIGGNNLMIPTCGPYDQRENEKRSDNILFTSDTFKDQMFIVGRMSVSFKVSSNCTDTDFVVRFSDVYPDGRSMLLGDSILRMRWRESNVKKTLMEPGTIYPITISMWPTAYIFNPGHAMRITITSSNSPRFSINPNNGLNLNQTGPQQIALNTLFIDDSAVFTLPLVKKPFMLNKAKVDMKGVFSKIYKQP
ncbi:peptidase S15 [Naegleria gruberi]|uniref:Peptidase S15 n=1 Tax=Naegleria gruberi TaxID=5762 RepID=D2VL14_NAEGR|nr:peptidase S15 [Naegleria gruberi]EFC42542.1 peptidase S15 [Naegleria gruberi]|eukprot:XP_002675286.1 peptidase S15 [Naegleria gruberi]